MIEKTNKQVNLGHLSEKELKSVIRDARRRVRNIKKKKSKRPRPKSTDKPIQAVADNIRYTADHVYGCTKYEVLCAVAANMRFRIDKGGRSWRRSAKYRHPDKPELSWAGTGSRPKWLQSELDKGRDIEDFRVD